MNEVASPTWLQRVAAADPEQVLTQVLQRLAADARQQLLAVDFQFCEYWRDSRPEIALTALYHLAPREHGVMIEAGVMPTVDFQRWLASAGVLQVSIEQYLQSLPVPMFALDRPLPLQPVAIAKPWGQEIWYTGIEQRGVAGVGVDGCSVPLPWLLAIAPQRLVSGAGQPILLKILDPLPEPVFGDLYFELHREKQEVYVVTAVDVRAWPDGRGAIRFGFDAVRRSQFADDAVFLAAYLDAVRAYRAVRRQVDAQLDRQRLEHDIGLNEPVAAATLQRWLQVVPAALIERERTLRAEMEAFTALQSLAVGDVIKVPCLVPHSLQHGVRTVEFQTPVYERLIISFAQKVLTQRDWDTDAAATLLQLDPPSPAPFPLLARDTLWRDEQIVAFDEFEVRRLTLQSGAECDLQLDRGYGLGIAVGAGLHLNGEPLASDAGVLLPGALPALSLRNVGTETAYFLLALPC